MKGKGVHMNPSRFKAHIFIDTNLLEYSEDWFLESKNTRILSFLCSNLIVSVNVSSVVMEEFRKHFKQKIDNIEEKISKQITLLNELRKKRFLEPIKVDIKKEELLEIFNDRTIEVLINGFNLVKYPEDDDFKNMMDYIINCAIYEIPPFKKKDDGFRDSVIFESYLHYIKKHNLKNCYFVSKDKIFMEKSIAERINELGIDLKIVDNLDMVFSSSLIAPALAKKREVIESEMFILKKVLEFLENNETTIIDQLTTAVEDNLNSLVEDYAELIDVESCKIRDISFDYQFNDEIWITVSHALRVELQEYRYVYDSDVKGVINFPVKKDYINVGCETNLIIEISNITDFNKLELECIELGESIAEYLINEKEYEEIKFEDMPIW